jgi:hypothetical protein
MILINVQVQQQLNYLFILLYKVSSIFHKFINYIIIIIYQTLHVNFHSHSLLNERVNPPVISTEEGSWLEGMHGATPTTDGGNKAGPIAKGLDTHNTVSFTRP